MKKKTVIGLALSAVVIASCSLGAFYTYEAHSLKKYKEMPISLPEGFTYTAHTGCVGTEDNSLESIDVGAEYGADIVEFDLNFLSDGTPVLSHDAPEGEVVTLDEAFGKLSEYPDLMANVDAKSTQNLKAVKELAEKHGVLDRVFYTGIEEKDVAAVKEQTPDIPYYLNATDVRAPSRHSDEYLLSLVQRVKDSGAVGINFNKDKASEKLVEAFHDNGLLVSIWTVNKEKDIYRILSYSPDNITTRNPDLLKSILSK